MDKDLAALLATVAIVIAIASCEVARVKSNDDVKKVCLEKYQPEACAGL